MTATNGRHGSFSFRRDGGQWPDIFHSVCEPNSHTWYNARLRRRISALSLLGTWSNISLGECSTTLVRSEERLLLGFEGGCWCTTTTSLYIAVFRLQYRLQVMARYRTRSTMPVTWSAAWGPQSTRRSWRRKHFSLSWASTQEPCSTLSITADELATTTFVADTA
jgi:hypothetical protein